MNNDYNTERMKKFVMWWLMIVFIETEDQACHLNYCLCSCKKIVIMIMILVIMLKKNNDIIFP